MATNLPEQEKFALDAEREFTCQNIRTEILVENAG